jgi:hypothetical protein
VAIPPLGQPGLSSDFSSALTAKGQQRQHLAKIHSNYLKPPFGVGTYLPGGRPPVIVLRKGGRSPLGSVPKPTHDSEAGKSRSGPLAQCVNIDLTFANVLLC